MKKGNVEKKINELVSYYDSLLEGIIKCNYSKQTEQCAKGLIEEIKMDLLMLGNELINDQKEE